MSPYSEDDPSPDESVVELLSRNVVQSILPQAAIRAIEVLDERLARIEARQAIIEDQLSMLRIFAVDKIENESSTD